MDDGFEEDEVEKNDFDPLIQVEITHPPTQRQQYDGQNPWPKA